MICPNCSTGIHFKIENSTPVHHLDQSSIHLTRGTSDNQYGLDVSFGLCPECNQLIVKLRYGTYFQHDYSNEYSRELNRIDREEIIYPHSPNRENLPEEIPEKYRLEFSEAFRILKESPKASAAISRRILQTILREDYGIKCRTLAEEIDQFIEKRGIPSYITEAIDAPRNIGNFAAHTSQDKNTGTIVDVEPGEAEWLLDILEALFDFTFVQPDRIAERRKKLDAKLESMGKPPMK